MSEIHFVIVYRVHNNRQGHRRKLVVGVEAMGANALPIFFLPKNSIFFATELKMGK